MFQRVFYGALAIAILVLLFQQDAFIGEYAVTMPGRLGRLLERGSILPILFVVILTVSAVELARMMRAAGIFPHATYALLMIVATVLAPWVSAAGLLGTTLRDEGGLYWSLAILMLSVVGAGVLTVLRGFPTGSMRDMGGTVVMIAYLGFLGSFALQLRCSPETPRQEGVWVLLITILVTKASDIGAFFVGSAIGRRKLAPAISPGKSVEGFLGGLLGSVLGAIFFVKAGAILAGLNAPQEARLAMEMATRSFSMPVAGDIIGPFWRAVIFGAIMSGIGQVGDLLESCFKRDAGMKDSGNIIPRYGGMLDLIDSPIVTIPVAWLMFAWLWKLA